MNFDQWTGLLRALVPAFLGIAAGKGWIPNESVGDVATAVAAVTAAVWSVISNKSGKVIPSTATGK